jgi:hypothetical protein
MLYPEVLGLFDNNISDAGMISFAEAVRSGSLAALTRLELHRNQIGDAGLSAFSSAIATGALPKLEYLSVGGNPGKLANRAISLYANDSGYEKATPRIKEACAKVGIRVV